MRVVAKDISFMINLCNSNKESFSDLNSIQTF